ncbi:MAG: T9SS type A sorting domain-containing protein [Fibrobacter sp.]|nr:T9SS type A sorting domain-containing protein [Fibrobacter sp.]
MINESKNSKSDLAVKAGIFLAAFGLIAAFSSTHAADSYKFDFGDGPVAAGYTQIKSNTKFDATKGYGFESGTISSVDRLWDDDLKTDFLTSKGDMIFSVVLPQGNYEVSFTFGDGENESETTVWAENRKLMFDRVTTAGGVFSTQSVSLRRMETKSIDGSVTMSIKDREKDYRTWDNKLTFIISGKAPAVAGIEIKPKNDVTTLWLCGNSTVVDQLTAPWAGWGQMSPGFFKSSLAVANYAESGLTASGFYSMKRLAKILAEVKKGDYVTVQFAHNDQKNATDVANYETTLTKYANEIKAKGAIPLFVTSTARQGELDPKTSVGGLPEKMRALGQKLGVTVLDLNQHSINLQNALGNNKEKLYMYTASDKTHFCEYGAYELARAILEEMKTKVPDLAKHLRDNHVAFDSKKPDALDILTQAKAPITEGGLIQVPEEPESSSSGEAPAESSSSKGGESTEGTTSAELPANAVIGIQGDQFASADGVKETTNTGYTGEGYLNIDNGAGTRATYKLEKDSTRGDTVYIRFANGSDANRDMIVNGIEVEFPPTGSWTNWKIVSVPLNLSNSVRLEMESLAEKGGPNIDWIGWSVNHSADSSAEPQAISQNITGAAAKFSAHFSGNSIFLNNAPNGSYTISIFDMQGNKVKSIQNAQGNEFNVQLNHGTYIIRISQDNRIFEMTRIIKR